MMRVVVVLLIASFCANVSSNNDCIFTAIDILRGVRTINQVDQRQPPTPTSPTISRVATIDIETGVTTSSSSSVTITDFDRRPDNLVDFQRMYLNVKQHYEEKLQKLLRSTQLLLQNVQELRLQLTSISEKDESSQSRSSDADSPYDDGDGLIDWTKLPGTAVEISAKGREMWAINAAQNIFRWNGSDWELKPGTGVRLGSSPDGWTWMVNQREQIFRWNVYTNNWDLMPGALMQISAISKESAMGVSRNNQIYVWTSGAWKRLPGGAIWAAIGVGDERWVVSSDQTIHRWNHVTKSFDRIPGAAVNVDVHSPCRVIITNASNQMLIYKDNNWRLVNGAGTRSSINGTHIFTVNSAHEILIGN